MGYVLLTLFVICVPFACGLVLLPVMRGEDKSLLGVYLYGWVFLLALFFVLTVPMIMFKRAFSELVMLYSILLGLASIAGLLQFLRDLRSKRSLRMAICEGRNVFFRESPWAKLGWGIAFLLFVGLCVFLLTHQYLDGDDAYYVVISQDAVHSNTMYRVNPYSGYPGLGLEYRHALCPMPIFFSFLSVIGKMSPAVLCHNFACPLLILLTFLSYLLLGRKLVKEHVNYRSAFLLLVMGFYLYGMVSVYTAERFLLTIPWQGKSVLANLILPMFWVNAMASTEENRTHTNRVLLFLLVLASLLCSTTSVFYMSVAVGILAIVDGIRMRRWSAFVLTLLCILPCVAVGGIYLYVGA